ncbi:MAG TPA: site-2 protease family protein [Vicinamibacteria bacterium]
MPQGVAQLRRTGIHLFRIAGIDIQIDFSWFIVFALVVWSLSSGYFPSQYPDQPTAIYWTVGVVAAILFFLSILLHELAHSMVAIREGIEIPSITLFIFGGVSRLGEEARDPWTEFRIAVVGPLSSFALAGAFWSMEAVLSGAMPTLVTTVFEYLAMINLLLGLFNLVPGFPLDGGRLLRAFVWWRTGSVTRATRVASDVGKGFAIVLMILGGVQIFAGQLLGGAWLLFIGMFLRSVAEQGYQELVVRQSLEGIDVEDVMMRDVVAVSPDITLRQLVDDYFLKHGFRGFPVVKNGRPIGMIRIEDVARIGRNELERTTVNSTMTALDEAHRIAPDAPLSEALKKMSFDGVGRLIVMRGDEMQGILTKEWLRRFLDVRRALGTTAGV